MLREKEEIRSGIFDSTVQRPNKAKSVPRVVEQYEIELFSANGGTSHINGEAFPVRKGMVLCAKPGDRRYSDFPVRCSFVRIALKEKEGACRRVIQALPTVTYLEDEVAVEGLLSLFSKLSSALIGKHSDSEDLSILRIHSLFYEILCRLSKLCRETEGEEEKIPLSKSVREAYEYIREHYAESCTLSEIAGAVCLSPNYLHTAFTHQVGMTPFEYRSRLQMEKAKGMIVAGEKTMIEIALESGFCSQSHFNKVFKARLGISPAEYRKKISFEY